MTQLIIEVLLYLTGTMSCYCLTKKFASFIAERMNHDFWTYIFVLTNGLLLVTQHYSIMDNGQFFLLDFIHYQFTPVTQLLAIPAIMLQCSIFPRQKTTL
ncbi:hypothetical protein EA58_12265 [Photobacterium galatheae]|uniref:Uncharacterized protein n=1 Tax=Photobacterium galatheae TaxID=1654360 RepID=A0A066RLL0_9GAMM|nr:hypothetical protein EA58_12265 [Photobacterium galatheae]